MRLLARSGAENHFTSGRMCGGFAQWAPSTRPGSETAWAMSATRSDEVVVASTASGKGVFIQFTEDALFDVQVFIDRLENEVGLRHGFFNARNER